MKLSADDLLARSLLRVVRASNRATRILGTILLLMLLVGAYLFYFGLLTPANSIGLVWVTIVVALVVATGFALSRQEDATRNALPRKIADRGAIKGLRPYSEADAKTYSRLGREAELRACLDELRDGTFRCGVVQGPSGCGKTSFLRAGVQAGLRESSSSLVPLYIQCSEINPLQSIRSAIPKDFSPRRHRSSPADLIVEFAKVNRGLVLLIDQFEQFYLHRRSDDSVESFVSCLRRCIDESDARIMLAIREDFVGRLHDVMKAIPFVISPLNSFQLSYFRPSVAAGVLARIAEIDGLAVDADFLKEVCDKDLSDAQGLVSPVDLQVLAWLAGVGVGSSESLSRDRLNRLGGFEGLLERRVREMLALRDVSADKGLSLQVLGALADFRAHLRAGLLSPDEVVAKLGGTASVTAVVECLNWFSRSDVRLVTASDAEGTLQYELAHERLVPAISSIVMQRTSAEERIISLVHRRASEWTSNARARNYLLGIREWWRLSAVPRARLQFDERTTTFVEHSYRRLTRLTLILAFAVLAIGTVAVWFGSPWAIKFRAKDALALIKASRPDPQAIAAMARAISSEEDLRLAFSSPEKEAIPKSAFADAAAGLWAVNRSSQVLQVFLDDVAALGAAERSRAVSELGLAVLKTGAGVSDLSSVLESLPASVAYDAIALIAQDSRLGALGPQETFQVQLRLAAMLDADERKSDVLLRAAYTAARTRASGLSAVVEQFVLVPSLRLGPVDRHSYLRPNRTQCGGISESEVDHLVTLSRSVRDPRARAEFLALAYCMQRSNLSSRPVLIEAVKQLPALRQEEQLSLFSYVVDLAGRPEPNERLLFDAARNLSNRAHRAEALIRMAAVAQTLESSLDYLDESWKTFETTEEFVLQELRAVWAREAISAVRSRNLDLPSFLRLVSRFEQYPDMGNSTIPELVERTALSSSDANTLIELAAAVGRFRDLNLRGASLAAVIVSAAEFPARDRAAALSGVAMAARTSSDSVAARLADFAMDSRLDIKSTVGAVPENATPRNLTFFTNQLGLSYQGSFGDTFQPCASHWFDAAVARIWLLRKNAPTELIAQVSVAESEDERARMAGILAAVASRLSHRASLEKSAELHSSALSVATAIPSPSNADGCVAFVADEWLKSISEARELREFELLSTAAAGILQDRPRRLALEKLAVAAASAAVAKQDRRLLILAATIASGSPSFAAYGAAASAAWSLNELSLASEIIQESVARPANDEVNAYPPADGFSQMVDVAGKIGDWDSALQIATLPRKDERKVQLLTALISALSPTAKR